MRFIDLFCGIGGFHVGLRRLGHECVFACDSNEAIRKVYHSNFGIEPAGDIRRIEVTDIPAHDILCAGFPCQPFSKAGDQLGLNCPTHGDLIRYVVEILLSHKPRFFILENVANLIAHDRKKTWLRLSMELRHAGYFISVRRLSPEQFGIPQIRDRIFIVGSRTEEFDFDLLRPFEQKSSGIKSVLDVKPTEARVVPPKLLSALTVWQQFLDSYPKNAKKPHVPIWSMEFAASYPFENATPHALGADQLASFRGSHGIDLSAIPPESRFDHLPSYARAKTKTFPGWKIGFIQSNRNLYTDNKEWIDKWLPNILPFDPSYQKFEWNFRSPKRDLYDNLIQFRASGIRVKEPTSAPALVAMTTTQVPVVGWERRYMTIRECSRLQDLEELDLSHMTETRAFSALGNAVNARIVELIGMQLGRTSKLAVDQFKIEFSSSLADVRQAAE